MIQLILVILIIMLAIVYIITRIKKNIEAKNCDSKCGGGCSVVKEIAKSRNKLEATFLTSPL